MAKVIFWLVVFFLVLLALRLFSAHQARRRRDESAERQRGHTEPMIRCGQCGVYLPKSSAKLTDRGYGCGDEHCANRR
ncbi:MAG: hypothetical protein JSS05_05075 [Proteobacteria bacterium]|nr:hypothetical protein [Pseudomonadota bacterium]